MSLIRKFDSLIFFALLAFPLLFTISHFGGYALDLPNNIITWNLIILLICIRLIYVIEKQEIIWSKNTISLLLFFGAVLFTYFLNTDFKGSGYLFVISIFLALNLFLSLQQLKFNKNNVYWCLIFIGAIHGIIGLLQLFHLDDVTKFLHVSHTTRITSIFGQPNMYAVYMSVVCALLVTMLLEKKIKQHIFLLIFLFTEISILIANSRTGMLSLIIISIFFIFNKRNDPKLVIYFLIVNLIAITSSFYFLEISKQIIETIPKKADWGTYTEEKRYFGDFVRFDLYISSLKIFMKHWLFGIGYGDFMQKFYFELRELRSTNKMIYFFRFAHPHNEILYWILMGGIINLVTILFLIIKFFKDNFAQFTFNYLPLVPIVISLNVEHPFLNMIFFLVLLLLFITINESEEMKKIYKFRMKKISKNILMTSFIIIAFTSTIVLSHGIYTINKSATLYKSKNLESVVNMGDYEISPFVGKKQFDLALHLILFDKAVETKNEALINESINYWETKAAYIPLQVYLRKLYHLYVISNNEEKIIETEERLKFFHNKEFKIINYE